MVSNISYCSDAMWTEKYAFKFVNMELINEQSVKYHICRNMVEIKNKLYANGKNLWKSL